jgi:hypothetical protein
VQKGIVGEATAAPTAPAAQEAHTVAAAPNVTPFDAMPSNDDSGDLPF